MTWLQVWVGKPRIPSPAVMAAMRETARQANGRYVLITDAQDVFADYAGSIYPWDRCAEDHHGLADALRLVNDGGYRSECVRSDVIRFWYAACHGDTLYVDCDCVVKSLPEFKRGTNWFARYGTEGIEHLMFYCDDMKWMREFLDAFLDFGRGPKGLRYPDAHRLLNEWGMRWPNVIEPECFVHG